MLLPTNSQLGFLSSDLVLSSQQWSSTTTSKCTLYELPFENVSSRGSLITDDEYLSSSCASFLLEMARASLKNNKQITHYFRKRSKTIKKITTVMIGRKAVKRMFLCLFSAFSYSSLHPSLHNVSFSGTAEPHIMQ